MSGLLIWLLGAIIVRPVIHLLPHLDVNFGSESVLLSDMNLLAIWLLLPIITSGSIKTMWKHLPNFTNHNVLLMNLVITSDLWTIFKIFTTWTINLSVFMWPVQLFPAMFLVLHSFFQVNFLSVDRRSYSPFNFVYNVIFNIIMMVHTVSMGISFGFTSQLYCILAIVKFIYELLAVCVLCDDWNKGKVGNDQIAQNINIEVHHDNVEFPPLAIPKEEPIIHQKDEWPIAVPRRAVEISKEGNNHVIINEYPMRPFNYDQLHLQIEEDISECTDLSNISDDIDEKFSYCYYQEPTPAINDTQSLLV